MKKIVYRTKGSEVSEFVVTNREMADAMVAWAQDKNYNCPRLKDVLNRFILFTADRKHEARFQHFIHTLPDGTVMQFIFDTRNEHWYEFDKFTNFEDVVDNLITREKGGDAPLFFLFKKYTPEEDQKMIEKLTTVDDFFDGGGKLGY